MSWKVWASQKNRNDGGRGLPSGVESRGWREGMGWGWQIWRLGLKLGECQWYSTGHHTLTSCSRRKGGT